MSIEMRDMDIAYVLGDHPALQREELELLQRVWDRAYRHGVWHGLDTAAAEVEKTMNKLTTNGV